MCLFHVWHIRIFEEGCSELNTAGQSGGKTSKIDIEKRGLNEIFQNRNIPVEETDGRLLKVNLGNDKKFTGMIDNGSEIIVLRESVVPKEYLQSCGKIFLRPQQGVLKRQSLFSFRSLFEHKMISFRMYEYKLWQRKDYTRKL